MYYLRDNFEKIRKHKKIVVKVDEHNPAIVKKLDNARSDRRYSNDHTYQRIYDQKLTIHVQLKYENPNKQKLMYKFYVS